MEPQRTGLLILLLFMFSLPSISAFGKNENKKEIISETVPLIQDNPQMKPGSYRPVPLDDPDVETAIIKLKSSNYFLGQEEGIEDILKVERQVVAGTKYRIQYQMVSGKIAFAEVFFPLDGQEPTITLLD